MEPTLERRLREADPLAHGDGCDDRRDQEWLLAMARTAMNSQPQEGPRRRLLAAVVAAAFVALAAVTGGAVLGGRSETPTAGPDRISDVTELALGPDTPSMASCIPFSVDVLADMPIAFSGKVTGQVGDDVLITVDAWYEGPGTPQVRLMAPDTSMTSLAGTVDFRQGSRYLVTATNGAVNYCGYSGPWTQQSADAFARAFRAS